MPSRLRVLVASRSAPAARALAACFAGVSGVLCTPKILTNGHVDPLHGVAPLPDVLVLRFDAEHLAELQSLAGSDASTRPPLIVVGPAGSAEAFRLAVRAGAKDYLPEPLVAQDLIAAVERLRNSLQTSSPVTANVTVVMGAAGGVGTSFLACNLATALAHEGKVSTVLVDLDLGYAPIASFLDLHPERGLIEALAEVEALDTHALAGYVTRHGSGLDVIGAAGRSFVLSKDVDPSRMELLVRLLGAHYAQVVVDAPHHIDAVTATAIGEANQLLLVLQQSVVQVRNAVRLKNLLVSEMGVPPDRLRVIVNRHQRKATVSSDDIRRALGITHLVELPSQYPAALASVDSGVPIAQADSSSAISRAFSALQAEIRGVDASARGSFLRRALPLFRRD